MNASERKLVLEVLEGILREIPEGHRLEFKCQEAINILSSEACPHGCVDGRVQFVHPGLAGAYECPIHGKPSAQADRVPMVLSFRGHVLRVGEDGWTQTALDHINDMRMEWEFELHHLRGLWDRREESPVKRQMALLVSAMKACHGTGLSQGAPK